jgi:hypothetical protein
VRRDAVLAVRQPWREGVALVLTVVLAVSVPLAAWAAVSTGEQLARVERAAVTLEEMGPQAAAIAVTLADVTRELGELAERYGPALAEVSAGVSLVTGDLQVLADDLRPLASTLGAVAQALSGDGRSSEVGQALTQVQQAMDAVTDTVDGVATSTAGVAEQVRLLTSPETLAMVASAADAVDGLADLSERAGSLAGGYVDNAGTVAAVAWVIAVGSVLGSIGWLVWRVREHRRWQGLRRAKVGPAVLATVTGHPR